MIGVVGIVAGVVAPRFFETQGFQERFFTEEIRSGMTYAQKLAVASGCPAQVTFTATSFQVTQRTLCTSGPFTAPVPDPGTGASGFLGTAPPGITLVTSLTPVIFDALGRATNTTGTPTDVTITVGTWTIQAVGETGHVFTP